MSRIKKISLILALLLAIAASPGYGADLSSEKKLSNTIENIISSSSLTSSFYGVYVVEEETNHVLCDINSRKLFTPSSLAKLFTAAMALNELGDHFVFRTSVMSSQPLSDVSDGVLNGNIILAGRGDPTLSIQSLEKLAHQLELKGIRTINGQVLVDESYLDQHRPFLTHAEWEDLTWYYAPEVSALSINDNAIKVDIEPNPLVGQPALISCHQNIPYLQFDNHSKTIEGFHGSEVNMCRGIDNNTICVSGNICKNNGKIKERIAIHDPAEYTRLAFLHVLEDHGIEVTEEKHRKSLPLVEIAYVESRPLKVMLEKLNKDSDNLIAELLFRVVGKKANPLGESAFDSGKLVLDRTLQEISINPKECLLCEGVGLSRHNMVTPHAIIQLLTYMSKSPHKDSFQKSLAIAGIDGLLRDRFLNTIGKGNIRAKTGTFFNVSALAGYAKTKQGRNVVFCIIFNQVGVPKTECIHTMDNVLLTILEKS